MNTRFRQLTLMMVSASLFACSATQQSNDLSATSAPLVVASVSAPIPVETGELQPLTLEKIMADPDWIGRQPERPYWAADGKRVLYEQKRQGSRLRDLWSVSLDGQAQTQKVPVNDLHTLAYRQRVINSDNTQAAWEFEGNLFVKFLSDGRILQLTRNADYVTNIRFLNDGRIAYQVNNALFAVAPQSGLTEQLAHWVFREEPTALETPKDYIAEQQVALIDFVANSREQRKQAFEHQRTLLQQNPSMTAAPFYLPADHRSVEVSLSPDGEHILLVTEKEQASRDDSDIMPNYIGEDSRIKSEPVRRRVADAKPASHTLWLLDIKHQHMHKLGYETLPGYNEDVLAEVKRENAEANGETYQVNRLPRDIGLLVDWGWSQNAIQWHSDGSQVAIMLEAWDNKDRWVATVDFTSHALVSQHRLHDDAWINYNFNSFGWLNDAHTLYYLSEESGYSHLYVKPLNGKARALTAGTFEVDELTLSDDDRHMYFVANRSHPGIYEVYRVALQDGTVEQLTQLNGMTSYVLSPDQRQLLLTHSTVTMPPELYVKEVGAATPPTRLTHTVSEAFQSVNWMAPQIIPVPSTHADQPVYSRVYLPNDYQQGEPRRAVIFNHGAGYLQNAHLGWSGYFREYMFHNLLAQQGYVVMDMDYRASKGYGRDWRTAIYRQMGTPEVEDLRDGVQWLVNNANVDRNRIGTYGGSYGGFMTFMALFTAPDLFQAGAALRPVTDWAHYNHPYTSNILNTPDVDPIAYERSSPLYFAEGLQKPLLINAPMVDNNVFFVDVVRLVQRLIELEKQDFETAIYPVEPHGFVQPSSWLDEYRRIYKLFEENL